jgi:hypothetical protein
MHASAGRLEGATGEEAKVAERAQATNDGAAEAVSQRAPAPARSDPVHSAAASSVGPARSQRTRYRPDRRGTRLRKAAKDVAARRSVLAQVVGEDIVTLHDLLNMDSLNPDKWPLEERVLEPGQVVPAHAAGLDTKTSLLHRAISKQAEEGSDRARIEANVEETYRQHTVVRRLATATDGATNHDRSSRARELQLRKQAGLGHSMRMEERGPPRTPGKIVGDTVDRLPARPANTPSFGGERTLGGSTWVVSAQSSNC